MNVNTIKNNIKHVFLSEQNTSFILNKLNSSINKNDLQNKNIIQFLNQKDVFELENVIFDTYFDEIYTELNSKNKYSPEEIIIILNKIIISEVENFIISSSSLITQNQVNKSKDEKSFKSPKSVLDNNTIDIKENKIKDNDLDKNKDTLTTYNTDKNIDNDTNKDRNKDTNKDTNKDLNRDLIRDLNRDIEREVEKEIRNLNNLIEISETTLHFFHFFSDDSKRVGNKWSFKLDLQNIKSISLDSFRLNCNFYNINDSNNKFELYESNDTQVVTIIIPHGYYTIDALLNTITNLLNENSPNKFKYSVSRNQQRNRVYFSSISNSKLSSKSQYSFSIKFIPNKTNYSLASILGFTQSEYSNNSSYVSENFPKENIYDDLYMKIFINDINLPKYVSTKNILSKQNKNESDNSNFFTYFEKFYINMNSNFGKSFVFNKTNLDNYDLETSINSNYISFEFMNSPFYTLNSDLDFQITLSLETTNE